MADFAVTQSKPKGTPKTRVVNVSGEMTIQHADEIKAALLKALGEAEQLRLDVGKVTEVDLAGLQLLCSVHRASIKIKKSFAVIGAESDRFNAAAAAAGFPRHIGCVQDVDKTCVWVGGGS